MIPAQKSAQNKARRAAVSNILACCLLGLSATARAGFAPYGQGMQTIAVGSLPNAALFLQSQPTWLNASSPAKPYAIGTGFVLPACDQITAARLLLTVWGGTANYTCQLRVSVNGTNLPAANPLTFGTTNDANPVFSPTAANVYGGGSGVWLVSVPVPPGWLRCDGGSNVVEAVVDTADSFDGRIQHVTLWAIRQGASLNNTLDFAIAEGTGDLYTNTTSGRVASRSIPLGSVHTSGAVSARLHALWTYADIGQNDRLFINGTQVGGDDVAGWDKTGTGLDYGPSILSFDVLAALQVNNTVKFTVSSADGVPVPGESSLRPSFAALEVTRPPVPPTLSIGMNVVVAWPVTADTYQLQQRTDLGIGSWTDVTNAPHVVGGQNIVILPRTTPERFYQLLKSR